MGAYRCNGMISHDHDIDLAIYSKETFDKLLFLFQEKLPKKYNLHPWRLTNKLDGTKNDLKKTMFIFVPGVFSGVTSTSV